MPPEKLPRYEIDLATGCWNWLLAKDQNGYGKKRVSHPRRWVQMAHRWMYEQMIGPIPEGLDLDHLCRNPACVNPAHLEAVTHKVNTRRGIKTKLTPQQVRTIRLFKQFGLTSAQLAEIFGMSTPGISKIICRQRHG